MVTYNILCTIINIMRLAHYNLIIQVVLRYSYMSELNPRLNASQFNCHA